MITEGREMHVSRSLLTPTAQALRMHEWGHQQRKEGGLWMLEKARKWIP